MCFKKEAHEKLKTSHSLNARPKRRFYGNPLSIATKDRVDFAGEFYPSKHQVLLDVIFQRFPHLSSKQRPLNYIDIISREGERERQRDNLKLWTIRIGHCIV